MSKFDEAAVLFKLEFPVCPLRHEGHVIEGQEYNTDSPNAFQNGGEVNIYVLCKVCGIDAVYVGNGLIRTSGRKN